MEVHHHPELPNGEQKRFKEYFLEFLMIFLAVSMGYIAENVREHLSDNSKEKEYITSLIKNLEVDTANLKIVIKRSQQQINGIDTLLNIPKNRLTDIKNQDSLQRYTMNYLFYLVDFKNDDITLTQLRNSGGYRLIRKDGALDSIAAFEKNIQYNDDQFTYLSKAFGKTIDAAGFLFDLKPDRGTRPGAGSAPILITSDKTKIYDFYNKVFLMSESLGSYHNMLQYHLKYTSGLISYLKKEYP